MSHRQMAKSLSVSTSIVSVYSVRATSLGIVSWPLPDKWDDESLERAFFKKQTQPKKYALPDWPVIHQELRPKTMTPLLLWGKYADRHAEGHYSYNHFCRLYKAWRKCQKLSMRQTHKAGEKLFVDYCGPTMNIIDPTTGEYRTAQVFVRHEGI
jgi:transposase